MVVYRDVETFRRKSEREAKKLAERWAANREAALAEPGALEELIRQREQPVSSVSVRELIDKYVASVFPLKAWGESKTNTLRQIQRSAFGDLDAASVVAADIIDHC